MEDMNLNQILEELQKNTQNPELIKDNKFYFEYAGNWYRVGMPNQRQLAEANNFRNKRKIQMLQAGKKEGYLLKKDLIEVLKKEGTDIEKIDAEIQKAKDEIIQVALTAAQKSDSQVKKIAELEEKTKVIENKIRDLVNQKMEFLSPAIEFQAEDAWYKLLVTSCSEKAVDETKEKWEKVWASFEDFEKDSSTFPYIAEAHFVTLLQNG